MNEDDSWAVIRKTSRGAEIHIVSCKTLWLSDFSSVEDAIKSACAVGIVSPSKVANAKSHLEQSNAWSTEVDIPLFELAALGFRFGGSTHNGA